VFTGVYGCLRVLTGVYGCLRVRRFSRNIGLRVFTGVLRVFYGCFTGILRV
jgi:hypothetical protein